MRLLFALPLLAMAMPVIAQDGGVDAPYANRQLQDSKLEVRATALMETLRCIQCQGQSIADSDAPIAGAMRSEVRRRIKDGEKPEAIRKWLIARYGEYVSYEPSLAGSGLLLWFAPLLLLAGALWMASGLFRKKSA